MPGFSSRILPCDCGVIALCLEYLVVRKSRSTSGLDVDYVKFKRFVSHGSGPCVVVIEQVGSFNRVPQADIPVLICRR